MTEQTGMDWLGHTGRVCVVTGEAGGIGKEIADQFARAGAAVAYLDLNAKTVTRNAEAVAAQGGRAIGLACNVGEPDSIAAAAAKI